MLGFMPPPVADELLYGWLARHAAALGLQRSRKFKARVLGESIVTADLPCLAALGMCGMPKGWQSTADSLLERMTTLPYYEHGMKAAAAEKTRRVLSAPGGLGQGSRRSGRSTPATLRWCPHCARADCAEVGMPTWRRVHQLPEVYSCREHRQALRDSGVAMQGQPALVLPPVDASGFQELRCPYPPAVADRIAASSAWLLDQAPAAGWRGPMSVMLGELVAWQGWYDGGCINARAFARAVEDRFGEAAIREPCLVFLARYTKRLHRELRTPGGMSATKMLLLLEVCGETAEGFFTGPRLQAVAALAAEATLGATVVASGTEGRRVRAKKQGVYGWRASAAKDMEWAAAVEAAQARILAQSPPRRVTVVALARELGRKEFGSGYKALPRTCAAVLGCLEPRDDFHLRRLGWLAAFLSGTGTWMSQCTFLQRVGPDVSDAVVQRALQVHAALPTGGIQVGYGFRPLPGCRLPVGALPEGWACSAPA